MKRFSKNLLALAVAAVCIALLTVGVLAEDHGKTVDSGERCFGRQLNHKNRVSQDKNAILGIWERRPDENGKRDIRFKSLYEKNKITNYILGGRQITFNILIMEWIEELCIDPPLITTIKCLDFQPIACFFNHRISIAEKKLGNHLGFFGRFRTHRN